MLELGYSWDLISDRQIQQIRVVNNRIITPGGEYEAIVMSGVKYLPLQTLQKLVALSAQGATIIFHNGIPVTVPGLNDADNKQKMFDDLLSSLKFETTSAAESIMPYMAMENGGRAVN